MLLTLRMKNLGGRFLAGNKSSCQDGEAARLKGYMFNSLTTGLCRGRDSGSMKIKSLSYVKVARKPTAPWQIALLESLEARWDGGF